MLISFSNLNEFKAELNIYVDMWAGKGHCAQFYNEPVSVHFRETNEGAYRKALAAFKMSESAFKKGMTENNLTMPSVWMDSNDIFYMPYDTQDMCHKKVIDWLHSVSNQPKLFLK